MSDEKKDAGRAREPQSYGSEKDWLEGKTDQTVENTPSRTSRHDESFYDNRHEDEPTDAAPDSGKERPARALDTSSVPLVRSGKKVAESNETRQSFFRSRDYD